MTGREEWQRIDAALDEILALPREDWARACARLSGGDPRMRGDLESLLAQVDGDDPILDHPAAAGDARREIPAHGLEPGTQIGAYRIVELLGRGGMGEVYRARRADGQFDQEVAIKVIRREIADRPRRFHAERQILARIEHPNIARLHDGGVTEDGRPYMVMELVVGTTITAWCRERHSPLAERLGLFARVCQAVAHAHQNLIVHGDLKPANVLVTTAGEVKLLDFGIAKLLDEAPNEETRHAALTPGHAAPEQFTGGPITTATDVYALGMLLFELLTGSPPWGSAGASIATLVGRVLNEDVPLASAFAAHRPDAPLPARALRGDLDAIIAKATRKEPERRYASVTLLEADVLHALRSEPVVARTGARWYVTERFVRRHRFGVAAGVAFSIALLAAGAAIAWQGQRAQQQAQRAEAVKDFLIGVFRASDPRIASDRPRGQATAKELLDAGAGRIERDFAHDPDLRIELLGTVAPIYRELGESSRYGELQQRELELVRSRYGELHPIVTDILLDRATDAVDDNDYPAALKSLDVVDALLKRAGRDQSSARARWWLVRGQALIQDAARQAERKISLENAVNLYARVAPADPLLVTAISDLGTIYTSQMDDRTAASYYGRAIAVAQRVHDRNDGELVTIYGNLAEALQYAGDVRGADQAFAQAARLAALTYGAASPNAWFEAAKRARMLHLLGERAEALRLFAELEKYVPTNGPPNHDAGVFQERYGGALAAEGRPELAIPRLESAERHYMGKSQYDYELRRLRLILGDAYDGAGRVADARRALRAALDERLQKDPPDLQAVLAIRERWGRFLLDRGDLEGAEVQFREVLAQGHGRPLAHVALAQGDLARLDLARKEPAAAVRDSAAAVELYDRMSGWRDVRMGPYIWRIRARASLVAGDARGAAAWARKALDASELYDAPESPAISDARSLLQAAAAGSAGLQAAARTKS